MGTSISHASPRTANWRAVGAIYESEMIPADRASQELWRAATNQPAGNLGADLGHPVVATCAQIVRDIPSRADAIARVRQTLAMSGVASLATDIAQRAAVSCFAAPGDRVGAFVQSLVGEATNYLVSRDLPGHVGRSNRIATVSDAMSFKAQVLDHARQMAQSVLRPPGVEASPSSWKSYITTVVGRLEGRE
jgi:hypothetical protein